MVYKLSWTSFKSESSHIKRVPPFLRISAFMHGHGHPELAKKLNDKIPKTVDEMFERVRAFIRGEVVTGSAELVRPSQWDKGNVSPAWSRGPEKARNRGDRRSCGLEEVGPSGEGHPPEQPEERESRKEQRKSHKHDKGRRKSQKIF
ncbi:hypothetical protein Tco_1164449 [Tanacetum coccineum]